MVPKRLLAPVQFNEAERPQSDSAMPQLLSPILLLVQQVEFLEELWSGGRAKAQGPWMSISVFCVIILFNIINQEIFAKQVRNSLVVRRLRNVVWNSTGSWQVRTSTVVVAAISRHCIIPQ